MSTIATIKKIAVSTAIAASLGLGGLGLATGIASAAPGDHPGLRSGGSTASEHHTQPAPKTATGGDDSVIHAHLIPGFAPKPNPTTAPQPASAGTPRMGMLPSDMDPDDEDELRRCGLACFEIIDE